MRSDSGVGEAMKAARDRPNDPDAKAAVARAWLRVGKPRVAMTWARDAFLMKKSPENAALLRSISEVLGLGVGTTHVERLKRVEPWEVMATSLVPQREPVRVESQLNAMFGGELFRERTRVGSISAPISLRPPRKVGSTFVRLVLVSMLIGLVAFGLAAHRVKRTREVAQLAHDLGGFLRTGELRHADETLDRARVMVSDPDQARALAPLFARTEATLYRYVDSSEERKKSVESILASTGEGTFDTAIARALITPDGELVEMQAILRAIAVEARDPEATFLFGASLAAVGRTKDADRAYARALDLEPSHLPHLAHYAAWLMQGGRAAEADELMDQMKAIDPASPWIGWVEERTR